MVEQTQNQPCASFVATSNQEALKASKIEEDEFNFFGVQSSWKSKECKMYASHRDWGLVGMVFSAYNKHHELILRPDDFWQAIVTQFSFYVNKHAETLRDRIVDHDGQKELKVVMNQGNFLTIDYGEFASRMVSEQVIKNIKDPSIAEWLQPNFSTTTETDRIAASVSIMATLQKYFKYVCMTECGLPRVTMLGVVEDWIQLRSKIDKLIDFDINGQLAKWHALLARILDKLVESAKGVDCLEFWDLVLSEVHGGSGYGPRITGWMATFCIFNSEGDWCEVSGFDYTQKKYDSRWPYVEQTNIPAGVCVVPVNVDDNGTEYETQMSAGHFAFATEKEGTAIRPQIDWVIELDSEFQKRKAMKEKKK